MQRYDVIVIGAGAAGLMCAIEAGRRGRAVLIIDHAKTPGEKIRISGGGRCNFTNTRTTAANFISQNPHFCKSALSRYTPIDFIEKVDAHQIAWHEKTLGQLFCDESSKQIITMLTDECADAGVEIALSTSIDSVSEKLGRFHVATTNESINASSLVVATGGKSIPKMGATDFAYRIARQFGLNVIEPRPALVPLTFDAELLEKTKPLSGVSTETITTCNDAAFREAMLFTHRGLSGPSILQISSYWREGDALSINLAPAVDVAARLQEQRQASGKTSVVAALTEWMPRRLAETVAAFSDAPARLGDLTREQSQKLIAGVTAWRVKPVGSEGYRTAEVTLGGVDTNELSSKTMEAKRRPGLYFIGEGVDVTGWLGGYNFQWAWASGWAAGQVV